jgi:Holliday junction resolvase RusA-like endonuclease
MYKFTLPFPPSNNTYYRHVGDRILLSKKGRDYKQVVSEILQKLGLAKILIEDAVLVRLELYHGDRRSYDSDNFNKAVYDSLSCFN